MLEVAKRELMGFEADLELQRVTLQRQKELFAGRAATAQALDEAQAKKDLSRATVETGKGKSSLAEANLRAARADANRLQTLLEYNKIIAPFDGVVTRRLVNPGDLVQAATSTRTTPLFTCQKIDVVRGFAEVPESSASAIRPGTRAEVRPYDAAEPTVKGAVTRIANALDLSTRTMRVEIDRRMSAVDLPTTVRVAMARNIDIQTAQEHVAASRGEYEASIGMIFPSIQPSITARGLRGAVSTPAGLAVLSFNHLFPTVLLQWIINPGQVAYDIIPSKRRLEASDQRDLAVVQETMRAAAVQYYDVVLAQAQVAVAH